jgi:hypothetical protein
MTVLPDLNATFLRAQAEILADIADGTVPPSVQTFSELHDHVDANGYGGLFELEIDPSDDEHANWVNDLQNALDAWLRDRPVSKAQVQIPGIVHAVYNNGRITGIEFWPDGDHADKSAIFVEGDESLDIEDTDGPFWKAMQAYIAGSDEPVISWRE